MAGEIIKTIFNHEPHEPRERLEIPFDLVAAQYPHATEQRFERVCRIIKLQED